MQRTIQGATVQRATHIALHSLHLVALHGVARRCAVVTRALHARRPPFAAASVAPSTARWKTGTGTAGASGGRGAARRRGSISEAPNHHHATAPGPAGDEAYGLFEAMYPGLPRIELFARNARPNWTAWGNEITEAAE